MEHRSDPLAKRPRTRSHPTPKTGPKTRPEQHRSEPPDGPAQADLIVIAHPSQKLLGARFRLVPGQPVIIGRSADLPEAVRKDLEHGMRLTARNTGMKLVVALNYGGRAELVEAARRIVESGVDQAEIDENVFAANLYAPDLPDPDLLIRTAGEMRVSNFLLWQISYAELWVTQRCWPDFDTETLHEALRDYAGRSRRFGGLS